MEKKLMNTNTNTKVFKDVVGYEGLYKISEYGEIFITKRNKFLKTHRHRGGYDVATLSRQGRKKNHYVHRLVGEAFLEPPENVNQNQINHIDGNKNNNHLSNLEWVSPSENFNHAVRTGLINNIVLIEEEHKKVMAYLYIHTKLTQSEIADVFDVSDATVSLAIKKYI